MIKTTIIIMKKYLLSRQASMRTFATTDVGHYFERLFYINVLIISLNWRLPKSRAVTDHIELFQNEYEDKYHEALQMLQNTDPSHVMFHLTIICS